MCLKEIFNNICYDLKTIFIYPFQRLFRGYADKDLWNLDVYYSKIISKTLKAFKNKTFGYPPDFKNLEEWQAILDKMIMAFDLYITNIDYSKFSEEEFDKIYEQKEEGLDLFRKYFRNLWW